MTDGITAEAIGALRTAAAAFNKTSMYQKIVEPRDQVLARFQPVFSTDRVSTINAEEFKSFLLFENNHHWTGLQRQGTRMCSDMTKLRHGLSTLLAEDRPLRSGWIARVRTSTGWARTLLPQALLAAHPDKYGVWNNRSEAQMKRLGLFWGIRRSSGSQAHDRSRECRGPLRRMIRDANERFRDCRQHLANECRM